MTSRWAFEALAVNQFKENEYEKIFYYEDKRISIASYKKDYWMQKILNKIAKIDPELKKGNKTEEFRNDVQFLYTVLSKEEKYSKKKFADLARVTPEQYDENVAKNIREYLASLKDLYISVEIAARKKKDELTRDLIKKMGNEALVKFRDDYENKSLTQLVKNANDLSGERSLEQDGRLIQQTDPVFQDPTDSKIGRAHFFAPRKYLLGKYYPTFIFNICVIWLMSIILIITLYFDVFKKILDVLGSAASLFRKKKEF
jgi:ABC transport system ATP-binding/permease protein